MKWRSAIAALLLVSACRTATPPRLPGLPLNFGAVEEGKIYRGAQPTVAEIAALQRLGIRSIVKLNRTDAANERAAATALGMTLLENPLSAIRIGSGQSCKDVDRAYAAMTDPQNWPVYVHCDHGRDRTGFLVGLFRERAEGWSYLQVSNELRRYGHGRQMRLLLPNITRALRDGFAACATTTPSPRVSGEKVPRSGG